jgi:hypothetical protein
LLQLDLTGNPVQQNKAYRLHVQGELQQLQQLDRQAMASSGQAAAVLSSDLLKDGATQWHSQTGVHQLMAVATAGSQQPVASHKSALSIMHCCYITHVPSHVCVACRPGALFTTITHTYCLCAAKHLLLAGPVAALTAAVASAAGWQQLLHTVMLDGRGLRSLTGLAAASRLVVASFADNLLTGLQGLQGCGQLQELNISNNLVTEVCASVCRCHPG